MHPEPLRASASVDAGVGNWSVGIGLSYPLFDNFRREDATQRAAVEADVARRRSDDAARAARAELKRVLAALELAEEEIALGECAGCARNQSHGCSRLAGV